MPKAANIKKDLVEIKNRYRDIFNSSVDGIFLKDLSGRYLLINNVAARSVGRKIKDFIGKTDFDVFPKSIAGEIVKMDRKVLRTKRTVKFEEKFNLANKKVYLEAIKYPILDGKGKAKYLCGIIRDITELKRNQNVLAERIGELGALYKISKDIDTVRDLDMLLKDIVKESCKALACPGSFFIIWFYDKKVGKKIKAYRGLRSLNEASRYLNKKRVFNVPIKVDSTKGGGIVAGYKNQKQKIVKEEKDFISEISGLIGKELERRKVKEDLSRMFIEVVKTLSAALDARDHYTVDHSKRISNSCTLISNRLNLSHKERENLIMGALLHDIGKIGISDGILGKPSRLTPEEFDKVKQHPLISEEILKPIEALKGTLKTIRYHHERYDGKGYPDGLKGEKIPIGARILTVCDSYDAMVSERPYRKAMAVSEAVAELKRHSRAQFDPKIAKIMIDLIEKNIFR